MAVAGGKEIPGKSGKKKKKFSRKRGMASIASR